MSIIPGIGGIVGGILGPEKGVKFLSSVFAPDSGPSYTINGVPYGEAGPGRKLLIATYMTDNGTMSAFTIGGVAPSAVYAPIATAQILPRFWAMDCPEQMGGSGQLLLNVTGQDEMGFAFYSVFGWDGSTILQSFNSGSGAATSLAAAFTGLPNGAAIVGSIRNVGGLGHNWTNATEQFDYGNTSVSAGTTMNISGAVYQNRTGSSENRTVTSRADSGTSNMRSTMISIPITL